MATSLTQLSASSRAVLGSDGMDSSGQLLILYDPLKTRMILLILPQPWWEERTAAFTIGSDFHRKLLNLLSDDESDGEIHDENDENNSR